MALNHAQVGPKLAEIGLRWPKLAPRWLNMAHTGPSCSKLPKLAQVGPNLVQVGSKSARTWLKLALSWLQLEPTSGQYCHLLFQDRPSWSKLASSDHFKSFIGPSGPCKIMVFLFRKPRFSLKSVFASKSAKWGPTWPKLRLSWAQVGLKLAQVGFKLAS